MTMCHAPFFFYSTKREFLSFSFKKIGTVFYINKPKDFLNDWEIDNLTDFFNSLEETNNLNTNGDSLQWFRAKKKKLSTKSAYRHLDRSAAMLLSWPWKIIWNVKILHKVACFTWLVASQVVLAQDNLMKRGRELCSGCFFCERETETINHLFIHCKATLKLWLVFFNLRGISWSMLRHTSEALTGWSREGNMSGHKERCKIVLACIWWKIWKERNQRCFGNKSIPFRSLKLNCLITFYFWCNSVLPNKLEDITHYLNSLGGV